MQTILGATGQIAVQLARELHSEHPEGLRLVSRNPRKVNDSDELVRADLLDAAQTTAAMEGSSIVYFTAGLPANTELWEQQFPTMLQNALHAARAAGAKFAYFDNTYMYPQDDRIQTEDTPFEPAGRKGRVRAAMASTVLEEMARGDIPVLIARAPEFYGPGRTQSFTNALITNRLRKGRKPLVPVRDDRVRSLIWTPDASRGLAVLGNTPDASGRPGTSPSTEIGPPTGSSSRWRVKPSVGIPSTRCSPGGPLARRGSFPRGQGSFANCCLDTSTTVCSTRRSSPRDSRRSR